MISILGGLLMMLGSFWTYRGNIEYAIVTYAIADFAWIYNAWILGDIFGAFTILFALLLGIGVYYKMQKGTFNKTIIKELP